MGDLSHVYLGWSSHVVAPDLLDAPKVPSNYKDPEVIARTLAKLRDEQARTAHHVPGVARLRRVVVLDEGGELVFDHSDHANSDEVALELQSFLVSRVDGFAASRLTSQDWWGGPAAVRTFNLHRFLPVFLYEALRAGGPRPGWNQLLSDQSLRDRHFLDPHAAMSSEWAANRLSRCSFVKFWLGVDLNEAKLDPVVEARMCLEICRKIGF